MKKLISLVLSLALVACMFSMSVGAANVVGTHKGKDQGTIDDGLSESAWNTSSSLTDVITLNMGGTHNRYAVDVTFGGTLTFSSGAYVWNVNNLQYETTETITLTDSSYTCLVENFSHAPVNVSFEITDTSQLNTAGADVTLDELNPITNISKGNGVDEDFVVVPDADDSNDKYVIAGKLNGVYAIPENKGNRNQTTVTFQAELGLSSAASWADVMNKYVMWGNNTNTSAYTLARFTVTISKVTPTP